MSRLIKIFLAGVILTSLLASLFPSLTGYAASNSKTTQNAFCQIEGCPLYYVADSSTSDLDVCDAPNLNSTFICWTGPAANVGNSIYELTDTSIPSYQDIYVNACSSNASQGYAENADGSGKEAVTINNFQSASNTLGSQGYGSVIICNNQKTSPGPEPTADQVINANINYTGLGTAVVTGNGQEILGPVTVELCDPGETSCSGAIQSVQSDTQNINTSNMTLTVALRGVEPGKYTVCSSNVSGMPCQQVTKVKDQVLTVNFYGTSNDANAIIGSSTSATGANTCESTGGAFAWFICAATTTISGIEQTIETDIINPLLRTKVINFNSNTNCTTNPNGCQEAQISSTTFKVWSSFRIYGDILLIIGLLIVVYAETIGGGIGEAYAVKKIVPRLLIAAILINLSIYIVAGLEDIFNIIGAGLLDLIEKPFEAAGLALHVSDGTGLVFGLGLTGLAATAAVVEGLPGIILLVVGSGLIAAIGVLVTLIFRQGLLLFLILTSPIAFALYLLPNTEQYFRKWWGLLVKTLMIYPIVTIVFAMSYVTSVIVSSFSFQPPIIAETMGIVAKIIPLFLIPFAFKLSGGVIGRVQDAVSGTANKLKQPINNLRKANRQDRLERASNGNLFRGEGDMAQRMNRIVQGAMLANKAGLDPRKMRGRLRAARSAKTSFQSGEAGKSIAAQAVLSNDDLLKAALAGNQTEEDARQSLYNLGQRGRELDQNVASITQARRDVGRDAFNDAAAAANAGTGTGYGSGPAEMLETINRVAGTDTARAARILAAARSNAERARRVDLYGAGFATSADQMSQLRNGQTNAETVNRVMTDEALITKSAGEIGTGRNNALTNMGGAIQRRLANAQYGVNVAESQLATVRSSGNATRIAGAEQVLATARHEQIRVYAATSAFTDVAGNSAPENAQLIGALNGQVTASGITLGEALRNAESNPEFQQYKKVYVTSSAAAVAGDEAAAAAAGGAGAAGAAGGAGH